MWPTVPLRVFIFAALVSAMPDVTERSIPSARFDQSTLGTFPYAAIINSLGATQLRLDAPSAL